MSKIGLKVWSTNFQYIQPAQALYSNNHFDYIELFSVPGTTDLIHHWSKLRIPFIIHAAHSASGFNLSLPAMLEQNKTLAAEALKYADELDAKHIIFHPGTKGNIDETIRQLDKIYDPRMLIENKPYLGLDNTICVGSTPEEILKILKNFKIGFCLDFGHAIASSNSHKINSLDYIQDFIKLNPSMYHLSDGTFNSEYDSHLNLGTGDYPLDDILALCEASKKVTLETAKAKNDSLDDFILDSEFVKKRWK